MSDDLERAKLRRRFKAWLRQRGRRPFNHGQPSVIGKVTVREDDNGVWFHPQPPVSEASDE